MNAHEDRQKLEGIVNYIDPHNKDLNAIQQLIVRKFDIKTNEDDKSSSLSMEAVITPDVVSIILSKIQIQLLLDVRDTLYEISRSAGVSRWGSKIEGSPSNPQRTSGVDLESETIVPSAEDIEASESE